MIAVIPPVLLAIIQFDNPSRAIGAWAGLTATQMIIGNFLDPKMMGRSLSLSPFVVFCMMIFWGWMWGIPGIFLAVPLTILMRILFQHVPSLRPVAVMMGGPEPLILPEATQPIRDEEIAAALSKSGAMAPITTPIAG
jgi:predicted PurR-regulated permease PerM